MTNAFQLEVADDRIALLTFDIPDQKVNTLSGPVMAELSEIVDRLDDRADLRGLIFCSGKPGQFIAGADLGELAALTDATPDEITRGIRRGHDLFNRLDQLPFPTVAVIDGHCLGGGTELVLSLDQRLVSDNKKTGIGLPEVNLGIIPGWGGTQRLPRLIGFHHAIRIISTGATVNGAEAARLGLVFDVVPNESLVEEARQLIDVMHQDDTWQQQRRRRCQPLGMSADQSAFAFAVAEGAIRSKSGAHYPAPLAALDAMKKGINLPLAQGLEAELETTVNIMRSPSAAGLIGVFFKRNAVDRNPGIDLQSTPVRNVSQVGVLGAGLMGAGIATAHARREIPTAVVDVDSDRISAGLAAATKVVESRIRIGRATSDDLTQMMSRLSTSTSHRVFADCDVVIEAVPENEALKTAVYGQLADVMRDDAILASNTSTISITRMAAAAPSPEQFVGMHFFSPVDRMALVEVIRGEQTADETIATTVSLARRIGKTPIVVRDCPGFLVNRVLMPYMAEAVQLLLEGAQMDQIDRVATRFGMPVGPVALHDMVGIDVACWAGDVLAKGYPDRAVTSELLQQMVSAGRLGKKSGRGFRQYTGRKRRPAADPEFTPLLEGLRTDDRSFSDDEITDRLFLAMLLEAVRALEEEIVSEPAHVDMAMILGTGFPAFRGGPLGWCDSEGAAAIVRRSEKYESLGKRFESPETLRHMAASVDRFYPVSESNVKFGG